MPTSSNKMRIYRSYLVTNSVCLSQAFRFCCTENTPQYYFPPFGFYMSHAADDIKLLILLWVFMFFLWKETGVPDSRHHIVGWSKIRVVDKQNQGGLQKAENMLECNFNFKLIQIYAKWRLQWLLNLN